MGKPLRESDSRRFRSLPADTSVHEIADRCRQGVIDFVSGTAGGWSRLDLELWLGASYRSASSSFPSAQGGTAVAAIGGVFETSLMEAADVVRELLKSCADRRVSSFFVEEAVQRGFVIGVQDKNGALGHVPVQVAGMTLVDRVGSLLVADFLTRPNDYESVAICEDCGAVSFEWSVCDHEDAWADSRESGVVLRDDDAPVSYAAIFPPPES